MTGIVWSELLADWFTLCALTSEIKMTTLPHARDGTVVNFLWVLTYYFRVRRLSYDWYSRRHMQMNCSVLDKTNHFQKLVPPGDFGKHDLYKLQWRMMQSLASTLWDRWHKQYLATQQHRWKWQHQQPNISKGCIVLLKDSQSRRNDWRLGIITETYPSHDGKVWKVQVKIIWKEGPKLFLRPINEIVLLLQEDSE